MISSKYNKITNKIYLMYDIDNKIDFNYLKEHILSNKDDYKNISFFNIENNKVLITFYLKEREELSTIDINNYTENICNIFTFFNIDKNLYYNFNKTKRLIYQQKKNKMNIVKITSKVHFINDD